MAQPMVPALQVCARARWNVAYPPPSSSPIAVIYVNVASTRRTLAHSAAAAELTAAAWGGNDVEHEITDLDRTPSHFLLR
jgi:hypothetical protein